MYKIAVLLAAYNGEKWIKEQIDSILNQESVDVKLFISCDLSTDKTMDLLTSYNSEKISILPYGERYGAAAPNFYRLIREVSFSDFDYIALSDQDDIWLSDKLISAINCIEESHAVAYSSNVTAFWPDGKEREIIKATPQRKYDYLFESPGPGCSFVLTKDYGEEFQRYICGKEDLLSKLDWHDWVIYAFARSKEYIWFIDEHSHMKYRQHGNNQLGANSGLKQFKKRIHDITSGYGIKQSIFTVSFLGMEKNEFVKKWLGNGRKGYIYLANHSNLCRRRKKDQILFMFSCVVMFIRNINNGDCL